MFKGLKKSVNGRKCTDVVKGGCTDVDKGEAKSSKKISEIISFSQYPPSLISPIDFEKLTKSWLTLIIKGNNIGCIYLSRQIEGERIFY